MTSLLKSGLTALLCAEVLMIAACNCNTYNVKTTIGDGANANLTINGLGGFAAQQDQYVTVNFSGKVLTSSDGSGDASFNVSQKFEIDPSGNIDPGTTIQRLNLHPGSWSVTAQLNSWTASCTGNLSKGGAGSFIFTYNTPGCTAK